MFLEVFIYLVIVFGILIISITLFEKNNYIDDKYVLIKNDTSKVKVKVEIEGLDKRDAKDIECIIKKGKYDDIYDIANEFEVICN